MSDPIPAPVPPPASGGMNSRTYATLMHLSAFAGFVVPSASLLAPLVMWVIRKDHDPFADSNGRNIMNFQISCLIYALVCGLLVFVLIGIPLLVALGLFNFVCNIVGAIRANEGVSWKYPLAIPFFRV